MLVGGDQDHGSPPIFCLSLPILMDLRFYLAMGSIEYSVSSHTRVVMPSTLLCMEDAYRLLT